MQLGFWELLEYIVVEVSTEGVIERVEQRLYLMEDYDRGLLHCSHIVLGDVWG